MMGVDRRAGLVDGDHVVQFYERDADLAEAVVPYLSTGLCSDGAVVVVATPDHRRQFKDGLVAEGIDVDRAAAEGRMVLLDAAATLEELRVDGVLDRSRFERVVAPLIHDAQRPGRQVRVYGELVALLWAEGDVLSAIELEGLWNELAARTRFSLFCAYPAQTVTDPESADHFEQVCHAHSQVVDGAPVPMVREASRRFAGATDDVRRARRFVQEVVSAWAPRGIVDDCVLLVSELATNAVRHTGSDFTVSLTRADGGVQIAVGDTTRRLPQVREADVAEPGGRGLLLIDCIASRWGYYATGSGKLVWAYVSVGPDGRS